jgi:hypothetical protein
VGKSDFPREPPLKRHLKFPIRRPISPQNLLSITDPARMLDAAFDRLTDEEFQQVKTVIGEVLEKSVNELKQSAENSHPISWREGVISQQKKVGCLDLKNAARAEKNGGNAGTSSIDAGNMHTFKDRQLK